MHNGPILRVSFAIMHAEFFRIVSAHQLTHSRMRSLHRLRRDRWSSDLLRTPFTAACHRGQAGRGGRCSSSNECVSDEFCHPALNKCMPFCERGSLGRDDKLFNCDECLQTSCRHVKAFKCVHLTALNNGSSNAHAACDLQVALKACPHCKKNCEGIKSPTRNVLDKPRSEDVWVVSYPKTGSTWIRHLISNMVRADFGETAKGPVKFSDVDSSIPFVEDGVTWTNPSVFRDLKEPRLFKTHVPWNCDTFPCRNVLADMNPRQCLCPACAQHFKRVIYIYRNGQDTEASYYRFLPNVRAGNLGNFSEFVNKRRLYPGVTWADHIRSWKYAADHGKAEILWVGYENLLEDPHREMKRIAEFLYINATEKMLDFAIDGSSMDHMKHMEMDEHGLPFYKKKYNATHLTFIGSGSDIQSSTKHLWATIPGKDKAKWDRHNGNVMKCLGYDSDNVRKVHKVQYTIDSNPS